LFTYVFGFWGLVLNKTTLYPGTNYKFGTRGVGSREHPSTFLVGSGGLNVFGPLFLTMINNKPQN
jgi:hypothetical protein